MADKEVIKALAKNILYNSTAQAIFNLTQTRHLPLKFFLAICIFSTLSASSYFVITNVLNYYEYEVNTISRHVFEMPTIFPKITFCNLNQFTTEFALEFLKEIDRNVSFPVRAFDKENMKSLNQSEKLKIYQKLNTIATAKMLENKTLKQFQANFSHTLEDILLSCKFNNQFCMAKDFITYIDLVFGSCFSFNTGFNAAGHHVELKKSSISGPLNGLVLDLYLNFHENLTEFNAFTGGLGGVLHIENNSYKIDHDFDGLYIETGKSNSISVHRQFESNLPRPYSNCDIGNDAPPPNKYKNFEIFKMILNSDYQYSQAFCLKQCTQMKAIEKCGCSNPFFVSLSKKRSCNNITEIECSKNIFSNRIEFQTECITKCPLECNSTIYRTSFTSYKLLGDSFVSYIKEKPRLSADFVTKQINQETAKESITRLNIFYESLSYEISREKAKIESVDLLANIGGTMSLFLGISILSFCELVEVLIEIFFILKPTRIDYLEQKKIFPSRKKITF